MLRNAARGLRISRTMRALLPHSTGGDRLYAFTSFLGVHGRLPNRRSPLLNDRFFWLRVSSEMRSPLRRTLTDKELCKGYVAGIVGEAHVVPTLAILHSEEEIDAHNFPDDCCIKSTHASGHVIIRQRREPIDREMIKSWLGRDYYAATREPNYLGLERKIIVEPIIFPGQDLTDYRIFCVRGEPRLINVDGRGETNEMTAFMTPDWHEIRLLENKHLAHKGPKQPAKLDEMLAIARKLSAGCSLLRVDLYTDDETIFVGELTNCHAGGLRRFRFRQDEEAISTAFD